MSKVPASLLWRRWSAGVLSAAALLGQMAIAPSANAQTVTQQVFAHYDLKGISAWPNGLTTGSSNPILLGPSWNIGPDTAGGFFDLKIPSFSIGPVHFPSVDLGRTGADVSF